MNRSLEELYNDYELSINKQKQAINEQRLKLKEAQRKHNIGEVTRLNRLISLLYVEKLELEGAAVNIRSYFRS